MTHSQRLRRVGILCCHCLRNLAFYLSWHEVGKPFISSQFWVNTNSNFLDITVLEWCKLFGDERGKQYFARVVSDPAQFRKKLFAELAVTEAAFNDCIQQMRTYRDKFVAHLDELDTMQIPDLTIAKKSTAFLYEYLLAQEAETDTFHDAPKSAKRFFDDFLAQGKAAYNNK